MLRAVRRTTARVLVTTVLASIAGTVTAIAVPTTALAGTASMEQQFVSKMNAARQANGMRPYSVSSDLTSIARSHSRQMATKGQLYHNGSLTSQVQNWQAVGENVGEGPTVDDIHTAFMHSTEHRANILDHDFTQVGVGVTVDSHGVVWVTEDFRQPMGSSSSSGTSRTTTQHTARPASRPVSHPTATVRTTTHRAVSHPAAPHRATAHAAPAVNPAALLKARLSKLRSSSAAAQSADAVSQAFDFLSNVATLSG